MRHLLSHGANTLLFMVWDQGSRAQWAKIRSTFPEQLRPRVYLLDLREGVIWPGQNKLLGLDNGPMTAVRGPQRSWTLWTDPSMTGTAQIDDIGNAYGWPSGQAWPAGSLIPPDMLPLRVPDNWAALIRSLPVAFQNPDQWGKPGTGTDINSQRTKRGQTLLTPRDLRALRELRVSTRAGPRWVGVQHMAAWLHTDVSSLTMFYPCQGEKCGFGPFCDHCATMLNCLQSVRDQKVACQTLAHLVEKVTVETKEFRTKRKAEGPPEVS